jgi:anti-anti-sigma regulatory factor
MTDMPVRADLILEPGCTLGDALEMQFNLLTADCSRPEVVIDGSQVERIDTAGLQLLVGFAKEQKNAGRALRWRGTSAALLRCSRTLGLHEVLELPPQPAQAAT